LLEETMVKKRICAELSVPFPFKPERPKVAPEVSRSLEGRRNAIELAEADKMRKIRLSLIFTSNERKVRGMLRWLDSCKGPSMNFLQ
jgi:hypothetical protein